MNARSPARPTLFYGLRLRHALALLVCLAVLLIIAGYFSVSAGKKAAFDAVTAQGRALSETLISSAEMIIAADSEFVEIGLERLSETVSYSTASGFPSDQQNLERLLQAAGAMRVSLIEKGKVTLSATSGLMNIPVTDIESWYQTLTVDPDAEVIYEFRDSGDKRYFWGYFPFDAVKGIFIASEWNYGQYGNEKLGLYYLLNLVGREAGVEYIMLQNQDGIVFASRKVASMKPISDDPFLTVQSDTTRSRIIDFQDRKVLETVQKFQYGDFDGIFRVGLSLFGYSKIASSMKRQVWLVVAALIILGMLGFGAVIGFQNYDLLKASLQKASVMSRGLLDSLPGPVVVIDSEMRITDINAAAKELLGVLSAKDLSYKELFPEDLFHFRQVLENSRSTGFESDMGRSDRRFLVAVSPLIAQDGSTMGAMAIAQDISEVRRLEQMAESRKRLSEMGALAATMAHEIRNPLNAIGITIQRMKNEIKPVDGIEDYDKFIDGLKTEMSRLNSIIEKFLAVARSVRPHFERTDVNAMVSGVVGLFTDQARIRKTNIRWDPKAECVAEIDKSAITQALMNVVKNGLEAVDAGGNVEVRVGKDGTKIRVSVIDDGPGMEDAASAIKPFFTTKEDGTGLGLATASTILADHGGELVIESSPGKGCRVDLIFPSSRSES